MYIAALYTAVAGKVDEAYSRRLRLDDSCDAGGPWVGVRAGDGGDADSAAAPTPGATAASSSWSRTLANGAGSDTRALA